MGEEKLSRKDLKKMMEEADKYNDGLVNCEGEITSITPIIMMLHFHRVLQPAMLQYLEERGREEKAKMPL